MCLLRLLSPGHDHCTKMTTKHQEHQKTPTPTHAFPSLPSRSGPPPNQVAVSYTYTHTHTHTHNLSSAPSVHPPRNEQSKEQKPINQKKKSSPALETLTSDPVEAKKTLEEPKHPGGARRPRRGKKAVSRRISLVRQSTVDVLNGSL